MAEIHISKMGETVDIICNNYYGKTDTVTELVLDENPGVSATAILPMGTKIVLPDIEKTSLSEPLAQLWG